MHLFTIIYVLTLSLLAFGLQTTHEARSAIHSTHQQRRVGAVLAAIISPEQIPAAVAAAVALPQADSPEVEIESPNIDPVAPDSAAPTVVKETSLGSWFNQFWSHLTSRPAAVPCGDASSSDCSASSMRRRNGPRRRVRYHP